MTKPGLKFVDNYGMRVPTDQQLEQLKKLWEELNNSSKVDVQSIPGSLMDDWMREHSPESWDPYG